MRSLEKIVGIIGLGREEDGLGRLCYENLRSLEGISQMYLWNRTKEKAMRARNSSTGWAYNNTVVVTDLDRMMETDILIVTADANNVDRQNPPQRSTMLSKNIPVFKDISRHLQSYEGTAIIASNPTDELSYVFSSYAGVDPQRVVGMNDVDRVRAVEKFEEFISMYLAEDPPEDWMELYTIGPHSGQVVPVVTSLGYFLPEAFRFWNEDFWTFWQESVKTYAFEMMHALGTTNPQTADAVMNVVQAIIDERSIVSVSTYMGVGSDQDAFIGYPATFKDGKAVPKRQAVRFDDLFWERFLVGFDAVSSNIKKLIDDGSIPRIQDSNYTVAKADAHFYVPSQTLPRGSRIFAGAGRRLYMWDTDDLHHPKVRLETPSNIGSGMFFDGKIYLGVKGGVVQFDPSTEQSVLLKAGNTGTVRSMNVVRTQDSTYIAGSSYSRGTTLWDVETGQPMNLQNGIAFAAESGFLGDREVIYFLGDTLRVTDMVSRRTRTLLSNLQKGDMHATVNDLYVVSGNQGYRMDTWTGQITDEYDFSDMMLFGVSKIDHIQRDDLFVAGRHVPFILRYDIRRKTVHMAYHKSEGNINGTSSMLVHGNYLLAGDRNARRGTAISLWDIEYPSEPLEVFEGLDRSVRALLYVS